MSQITSEGDAVFNRVRLIIVEELQVDPGEVTLNDTLRGDRLRADSLDLVNLVIAFAREFEVEMRDDEIRKIATVGDIVSYLQRHLPLPESPGEGVIFMA
jgi:acyl carrier protein